MIIEKRIFIISITQFGLFGVLLSRLFYLQIIKESEYKLLSDKNRVNTVFLYPPRGRIIDINGNIIADNKRCFNLLINKKDYLGDKGILEVVFDLLKIDEENQKIILNKINMI
jgi:penicillin-binding protein 2